MKPILFSTPMVQDISQHDAIEEGISFIKNGSTLFCKNYINGDYTTIPVDSFYTLWESINGAKSWNDNPWVWVIEFKQITKEEALS